MVAEGIPEVGERVMFAGQAITGGVESVLLTENRQVAVLPA